MLKPGGGCLAAPAPPLLTAEDDVIGPPRPGGGAAATPEVALLVDVPLPNCWACVCVWELKPAGGGKPSDAEAAGGGGEGCHCWFDSDSSISAKAFCVSWNGSKPKSSSPNRSSFDSVRDPKGSQPKNTKTG